MRTYAIAMLIFVFALLSGACAGRQVRTRSVSAPPRAEIAAPAATPTLAVETPDAIMTTVIEPVVVDQATAASEPAPAVPAKVEPKLTTQQSIARLEAEDRAKPPTARIAVRPRPKPSAATAVKDDGRQAAIGSLTFSSPAPAHDDTAPAAPSIQPAPRGAPTVITAGPAMDPASQPNPESPGLFTPDREAVAVSKAFWSTYLFGAGLAALIGILCGFAVAWRRDARLKSIASTPYDHLPDGAVLVQEVAGGRVVSTSVILPGLPPPRSEPAASVPAAEMDIIEDAWHADGVVMEEVPSPEPPTDNPFNFDFTDTPVEGLEPPTPAANPATPAPNPAPDLRPRFASGSGLIISSSDDVRVVSGIADASDPPREPRPVPEQKVILYEDDSANAPADLATATASN